MSQCSRGRIRMRYQTRRSAKMVLLQTAAALALACWWACWGADRSHAAGDAAKGKSAFVRECAICHTVEEGGPNRFGPNLFGVLHRKAGTGAEFGSSRA